MADALTFVERSSRHESIDESTKIVFQLPTSRESTRASYFGCADDCCNSVSFVETARRDRGIRYRGPTLSCTTPVPRANRTPRPTQKGRPRCEPDRLPPPAPRLPAARLPAGLLLLKMRKAVGED